MDFGKSTAHRGRGKNMTRGIISIKLKLKLKLNYQTDIA